MDFNSRVDSVSYRIDKFCGNESGQYAAKEKLIEIENYMIEHRFLYICKKCKKEYIVHKFLCDRGFVFGHMKMYHDNSGGIRKRKMIEVPEMNMLNKFICDVIYDYVFVKGYEPLFSITEDTV